MNATKEIDRFIVERDEWKRKAETIRAEALEEAADRAEIYYRQRCTGCGEFEEESCLRAIAIGGEIGKRAKQCFYISQLHAAILGMEAEK